MASAAIDRLPIANPTSPKIAPVAVIITGNDRQITSPQLHIQTSHLRSSPSDATSAPALTNRRVPTTPTLAAGKIGEKKSTPQSVSAQHITATATGAGAARTNTHTPADVAGNRVFRFDVDRSHPFPLKSLLARLSAECNRLKIGTKTNPLSVRTDSKSPVPASPHSPEPAHYYWRLSFYRLSESKDSTSSERVIISNEGDFDFICRSLRCFQNWLVRSTHANAIHRYRARCMLV